MRYGTLSVIVPAYNEEMMIEQFYNEIDRILHNADITYKIIFIDDGSTDLTWNKISLLSYKKNNVIGIRFSKNFGKESAIFAGLTVAADSNCCVVIDCDLQHPPEKIVDMYRLWQAGYDVVEGVKNSRGKESIIHNWSAKIFYNLMRYAVKIDMSKASDFKLLDSKAISALLSYPEKNTFFRALSSWIGFNSTQLEFDVAERKIGKSKWSYSSLFKYAINNISAFSALPMQLVTILGIIMMIVAIVLGVISFVQKLLNIAAPGFTTVILIQLFSSSIIMVSLGIIGYYIGKIYEQGKNRPRYIISEECGVKNAETIV